MCDTVLDLIRALEAAGELHRVRAEVSPLLEIAALADRMAKTPCPRQSEHAREFDPRHCGLGGKALLFERVAGCDFPVLINAYGSYRRAELALGCEKGGFEELAARFAELTRPEPPISLLDGLRRARKALPLLRAGPKRLRGSGACQEVVHLQRRGEVDLTRLPLLQCWPLDGDPAAVGAGLDAEQAGTAAGQGRYITFGGVHTIHAADAAARRPVTHNVGMYRLQLAGPTRLAMHWHTHHDGAAHWRSWKRTGKPMPVAIALGGESVLPYAATAPLPPGLSELLLAGFLRGRGIAMVKAQTVPLWVPARSEIVIEGYVDTRCGPPGFDPREGERLGPGALFEGPFGDHTGYYSLPDRYPVVEVTAVTHRTGAVFPATIVGPPPQEDYYLGKATERFFLPLLKMLVPDLLDLHLPLFGCFHNCAFVRIRKEYPLQARRVMHALWGAGQMAWTKLLIVVGAEVEIHDEHAVLEAIFSNCEFRRDLELVNGPLDILDHAAPRLGAGHKLGIDATRKIAGEEVGGVPVQGERPTPPRTPTPRPKVRFPGFGRGRCAFVGVAKHRAGAGAEAIREAFATTRADFVIAVDEGVDLEDPDAVLFHWCANCDPGRDLHREGSRIGFDATAKLAGDARGGQPVRDFPPPLEMSQEIRARVARRWTAYGFDPL